MPAPHIALPLPPLPKSVERYSIGCSILWRDGSDLSCSALIGQRVAPVERVSGFLILSMDI